MPVNPQPGADVNANMFRMLDLFAKVTTHVMSKEIPSVGLSRKLRHEPDCGRGSHAGRGRGRASAAGLALLLPLLVVGCGLRPDAMPQTENNDRAAADYTKLTETYVPVTGPLSLADAIARALKYNYDAELSRQEQTLQEQQLDLAYSTMLPRLAATAGYTWRNNDNAAKSIDEFTHQQSLDYSYSTTRDDNTAGSSFPGTCSMSGSATSRRASRATARSSRSNAAAR